jgi:pimeloyl-ACP methyl ester carboxylesterase
MPLSQALVRPNICLSLSGTALPSPYTSEKTSSSTAGESISSVLPAGEYTLTVTDMTSYEGISSDALDSLAFPDINVGINIKPWRTQRIEGRISIDDRGETMPVRLSKIELDSEKHRRPGDALDTLNPKKPVWVIVHGWHSSEESDGIDELAMSLTAMGYQVTTLDWRNAADSITLSGADWTPAVGKWAAKQLRAAGFEGSGINVVGHSWGSYVGYFIGKTIRDGDDKGIKGNGIGIGSIVALDSAADGILTNRLDSTEVNFRDISEMSWAIESSPVGSDARALSADYSFTIASNMARMNPDFRAHSFAVTAFSSLIQDATVRRELGEETMFSPAHLLRKEAPQFRSAMNELLVPAQDELPALTMEKAYWGSGWEGVITIEPWDSIDGQGNTSHNVFPVSVEFKDRSGQTRLEMLSPIRTDTTLQ